VSSIIYDSAELYDPATGQWSPTANMSGVRISHTATLLPNGKVLVVGGFNANATNSTYKSAEVYDWATGTWAPAPDLGTACGNHSATLLEKVEYW
jgi:N-acetylneuraminic acid mutarotase